jgi:hypothetical protein
MATVTVISNLCPGKFPTLKEPSHQFLALLMLHPVLVDVAGLGPFSGTQFEPPELLVLEAIIVPVDHSLSVKGELGLPGPGFLLTDETVTELTLKVGEAAVSKIKKATEESGATASIVCPFPWKLPSRLSVKP